ncbi:MAG: Vps62-related protein [candidate division Zixibacteria bacterium]|nr:Vps62-related protein [candidate division Zixibacteria bacterium]
MITLKHTLKYISILIVLLSITAGCKKSPTKPPTDTRVGTLLLNRLSVSVVPGRSESIRVTARDKNDLTENFTATSNDQSIATVTLVNDSVIQVTGVNYGNTAVTVTSNSGVSRNLPVWVYNHKVLDTGELLITFCDVFEYRWCDDGSGCPMDGSYYHPLPTDEFKPVGSLGFSGYYNPNGIHAVMVVKAKDGSSALASPLDYTLVWSDQNSNADDDGSFWMPVPPAGYKALGIVAQAGYNKPSLNDVVCVREDLTIPGEAGDSIWGSWYVIWVPPPIGSWKIDPPDAGPHEDAYLSTGTFVAVMSANPPSVHPVMNVLNVPLPMLAEAPYQTYVPKLTGYDSPSEETVPLMAKEMLVPCTIVKDALYDSSNPQWRISNSPFYRLERQVYYKLLYHNHNQTSEVQTNSVLIRSGVTTTESESYWNETSISVTVEAGVSIEMFSSKISTTVSTSFGYETMTSVAELQEKEVSSSINTPPGKAAALWQKYNRYVLKRHNGTNLEPVAAWEFGIDSYVTDEYPD